MHFWHFWIKIFVPKTWPKWPIFFEDSVPIIYYYETKNLGMEMWWRVGYTPKIRQKHPKIAFLAFLNQNFCTKNLTQVTNFCCGHCPYHKLIWDKNLGMGMWLRVGYTPKIWQKHPKIAFFAVLNQNFCTKNLTQVTIIFVDIVPITDQY